MSCCYLPTRGQVQYFDGYGSKLFEVTNKYSANGETVYIKQVYRAHLRFWRLHNLQRLY